MGFRKILAVLAMSGPFTLLAVLAILGRCFVSPWNGPGYSPDEDAQFLAYREPVTAVKTNISAITHGNPAVLDSAVKVWVKAYESGELQTVGPICAADDGMTGVRGEIENARKTLLFSLHRSLIAAQRADDLKLQSHRIQQMLQLAEVSKYNSALATSAGAQAQGAAIEAFLAIAPRLDKETCGQITDLAVRTECDPGKVLKTAGRFAGFARMASPHSHPHMTTAAYVSEVVSSRSGAARMSADTDEVMRLQSIRVAYESELRLERLKSSLAAATAP